MTEERNRSKYSKKPYQQRNYGNKNIPKIISSIEEKLKDSIEPEALTGLNSFERKLVHRHFDHNSEFQTRTYRDGNNFTLYVYPVGNIERYATEKARESLDTGEEINLPPMGSYQRYIVHSTLKNVAGIETVSYGEGKERHIQIISKQFGRGLKKIAKKIKLF